MNINIFIKTTILISLMNWMNIQAQSINSAGNQSKNTTAIVTWNVGDLSLGAGNNVNSGFIPSKIIIEEKVITGIKQEFDIDVSVYPNPTYNQLHIRNNSPERITSYYIIDSSGKKHISTKSEGKDVIDIDLSPLPNGLYILQITNQNHNRSFKIIKK